MSLLTIHSLKLAYLSHIHSIKERCHPINPSQHHHRNEETRQALLHANKIDDKVQLSSTKVQEQGRDYYCICGCHSCIGLLMAMSIWQGSEPNYGGHVNLTRQCAYHFLGRVKFVRRKATMHAQKQVSPTDFEAQKRSFLDEASEVSIGTGLLSAPDVNSTDNNQPWKSLQWDLNSGSSSPFGTYA